jgi:hypothetical protein
VVKFEGKCHLERPRHRWEDVTKMNFRQIGWECRDLIDLTQDKGQVAGCCEHGDERSCSIKCEKFLDQLGN